MACIRAFPLSLGLSKTRLLSCVTTVFPQFCCSSDIMPGKRPRANSESDAIDLVFKKLFALTDASKPAASITRNTLKELKRQLLSAEAEEEKSIHKAAEDFTLEEAVMDFGLVYAPTLRDPLKHQWDIEALPDITTFQPSACLESLLENYIGIYDRSTEAGCRVATDFLLCECLAVMRGTTRSTAGRRTPTRWDIVKVHCDILFNHTINPMPTISKTTPKTIIGGRVDHGVGIVIRSSKKVPNRFFHTLLLCVEAKRHGILSDAVAQLVVYLASLRQSRLNRGRSNASVHGIATDGLTYVFVTITHEGILKESRLFSLVHGLLSTVLGCLQYILETTMAMCPNLMPERRAFKTSEELEAEGDDPIYVDDSPHLDSDDEECY